MPLNKDRGLELFDNVRRAIERDERLKHKVVNSSIRTTQMQPVLCFSHRDEASKVERQAGVTVADNQAMQAMVLIERPTVEQSVDAPTYLLPIMDSIDIGDLILTYLIDGTYPTDDAQMKDGWKWSIGRG